MHIYSCVNRYKLAKTSGITKFPIYILKLRNQGVMEWKKGKC